MYHLFLCKIAKQHTGITGNEHTGITGNEQADSLAKSVAHSESHTVKKIPYTDLIETFKKNSYENNIENN